MMTEDQAMADLTELFRQLFFDDTIQLTPETTADDIEDWDSVNHINLIIAVEMRYGIKIPFAEVEDLKNVGDLAALIARKAK